MRRRHAAPHVDDRHMAHESRHIITPKSMRYRANACRGDAAASVTPAQRVRLMMPPAAGQLRGALFFANPMPKAADVSLMPPRVTVIRCRAG